MILKPGNEVKARLFAMYWGQTVLGDNVFNHKTVDVYSFNESTLRTHWLNLRPIESLTDEEKNTVSIIYGDSGVELGKNISDVILGLDHFKYRGSLQISSILHITDYLRSISIALPFTYLNENQQPQTASVTEQVEMGWIKLVTK